VVLSKTGSNYIVSPEGGTPYFEVVGVIVENFEKYP
jgi:hypothetical protein